MDEIIKQIKAQIEINFQNIKDQIEVADLEAVFDGVNGSRYIFHNLHSMDRFFINPANYVYEGEKLLGIPENLTAEELVQKPQGSEYTRLELILGQMRHEMWHVGLSSAITFENKNIWNTFTGLSGLRKMIKMKN